MLFFTMQGPLLLLERDVKELAHSQGATLPAYVSTPLTLGLLLWLGHYLFIPPAFITGIGPKYSSNISQGFHGLVPNYLVEFSD